MNNSKLQFLLLYILKANHIRRCKWHTNLNNNKKKYVLHLKKKKKKRTLRVLTAWRFYYIILYVLYSGFVSPSSGYISVSSVFQTMHAAWETKSIGLLVWSINLLIKTCKSISFKKHYKPGKGIFVCSTGSCVCVVLVVGLCLPGKKAPVPKLTVTNRCAVTLLVNLCEICWCISAVLHWLSCHKVCHFSIN